MGSSRPTPPTDHPQKTKTNRPPDRPRRVRQPRHRRGRTLDPKRVGRTLKLRCDTPSKTPRFGRYPLFSARTCASWGVRVAGMAPSCPRAKRIGRRGFGRVFNVWGKCGETRLFKAQGKVKGPKPLRFLALWYAP